MMPIGGLYKQDQGCGTPKIKATTVQNLRFEWQYIIKQIKIKRKDDAAAN